jgi:hypothetical protein
MSRSRSYNPLRGTMWLPPDVRLDEIDFDPLPEPADPRAQTALFAPDDRAVAA